MANEVSNGHMTNGVTVNRKLKLVTPIRFKPKISKSAADAI